eukprot:snap_masked-scaffold_6-processed-gene-0.28-mRNA-1 protein AED:0.57 eAED:0.60 QI:0/0/0/1/1/1/2/0/587
MAGTIPYSKNYISECLSGSYRPTPEVISHFRQDYGVLEVDEIKDIELTSEGYFLLVSWLGFERHEDSWEPLEILAIDVKDTVENFLLLDGDYKKPLRDAAMEVAKSTWKEDEVILRLDAVEFLAETPSLSQKWLPVEKDILRQCIQVFGVGNYSKIHSGNYLPYKTTQQLYTQTQRLLGKQSIMEYSTLRLDSWRVAKDNFKRYGVPYHVERSKIISRVESLTRRFFNLFRYTKNKPKLRIEEIFYFRCEDQPELRKDKLLFLRSVRDGKDLARFRPIINFSDVAKELFRLEAMVKSDEESEVLFKRFSKHCSVDVEEWQYQVFCDPLFLVPVEYKFEDQKCEVKWDKEENQIIFKFKSRSWMTPFFSYGSLPIYAELSNETDFFDILRINDCYFEAVVIDPPWKLANNLPVRGPSLDYEQMEFDEIPFDRILKTVINGFAFIWSIQAYEQRLRQYLHDKGYSVAETISWVKTSSSGNLLPSIEPFMSLAKETCFMIPIDETSAKQVRSHFGLDVIFAERREQSRKPLDIHEVLEDVFSMEARFLEVFGRVWNSRPRWATVGNELDEKLALSNHGASRISQFKKFSL